MTTYNGFEIDNQHRVFKNGKEVFTAWHQRSCTEEEAMAMIDLSNMASAENIRRQGNLAKSFEILKAHSDLSDEAREIEQQEFEDHMNQYYEQQNFGE